MLIGACLGMALSTLAKDIVWYSGHGSVAYSFTGKKSATVEMALDLFADDMEAVTGHRAEQRSGAVIEIFELDKMHDKDFRRLQRRKVPIDRIIAKPDAFSISVEGGHIVVLMLSDKLFGSQGSSWLLERHHQSGPHIKGL